MATVIEPVLALLQMQKKFLLAKSVELQHSAFRKGPKTLDPVDVSTLIRELIGLMVNPKMLLESDIDQALIAGPKVRVNDGVKTHFAPYNCLQRTLFAVRNYLRIDPSVSFENAEDDRLATSSTAALAANPAPTKVRFVDLNLSRLKRRMLLTFLKQSDTNFLKDQIDAFACHAGQLARLCSRKIHRKIAQNLAEFLLCNSGTAIIPVYLLHVSSLAPAKMCLSTLDPW